jgi:3-deoxy-D-manno-octulosonate 8-phosphate phosphatase (KDO 8-P phosphatase)
MICRVPFRPRARRVVLLLMDVDGVLTDGGLPFSGRGAGARTFDVKDGAGIVIARRLGLRTGLISGRGGADVAERARDLGVEEVHLKTRDKLAVYERVLARLGLEDAEVCYVGDDIMDLPVLRRAGLAVAPADAHPEVRRRVPFVTRAAGGRGAVREVVDAMLKAQGRWETALRMFGGAIS